MNHRRYRLRKCMQVLRSGAAILGRAMRAPSSSDTFGWAYAAFVYSTVAGVTASFGSKVYIVQ